MSDEPLFAGAPIQIRSAAEPMAPPPGSTKFMVVGTGVQLPVLPRRELFAVLAMQALARNLGPLNAANSAVAYADALIAELSK